MLEEGDYLDVYSNDQTLIFDGVIKPNRNMRAHTAPLATCSQPCICGLWVYWVQDGFESDGWVDLFVNEQSIW